MVLANYKLPELYNIFENNETYNKYIKDLFAVAIEYNDRAIALSALHTESFLLSIKKQEEFDPADTMCKMFDCMSETDQKRFCESMFVQVSQARKLLDKLVLNSTTCSMVCILTLNIEAE